MSNTAAEPQPRRSILGSFAPLIFVALTSAVTGQLFFSISNHAFEPQWIIFGAVIAVIGLLVEFDIRKQLSLARDGCIATAKIDETHHGYGRNDHDWVTYHFTTQAGELVDGKCTVGMEEIAAYSQGSVFEVYYDPQNPKKQKMVTAMWGVKWDD